MKALTFQGKERIEYGSIPDPAIEAPTDAIVQVAACAICGSDLHPYFERERGLDHGCAMGHEFTGEVVEIGPEVKHLRVGDRVMSPFTTSCGHCFYCKKGLTSRCVHGQLFGWRSDTRGLHGGQAEYVRVPLADQTLVRVPEGVSEKLALLLGDILSTGYFCAEQAEIRPGEVQVVVGCGPVGLMAIWAARKMGAETLFAVDRIPERLALAASFGAIPLDYTQVVVSDQLAEVTGGRGADAVMEAVGSGAATRSAFEMLRPGGTLSAVGVNTDQQFAFDPVEAYDKNITYRIGRCPARAYMARLVELARPDADLLESIFSHDLPLAQGAEAYRLFAGRREKCTKVLLRP